jgi:hypothetical protein
MPEIPQEVRDAVLGTYAAWRPYAAAVQVPVPAPVDDESEYDDAFAGAIERIEALHARIEYYRANPVFPAEEA